jgi:50S ribosomal protein L16 3-hydroxylase
MRPRLGIARRRRVSGRCHGSPRIYNFGVTRAEFRERLFEKDCWLARGVLPESDRFAWAEFEEILRRIEPVSPELQVFHHGQLPEDAFTEWAFEAGPRHRRLDPQRLRQLLDAGATLVINRMEMHSLRARRLSGEVSRFVDFPTLSNAYVSRGGDGSFGPHWDTHDVIVLQLTGRKRWRVFAPTFPCPLPNHTSRESGQACPSTPAFDITLEAGDAFYIPRGWWHDVKPLAELSLHLSVGVYVPSVLDALGWLSQKVLQVEPAARRGAIDDATTLRDLAAALDVLKGALTNPALMTSFREEVVPGRGGRGGAGSRFS